MRIDIKRLERTSNGIQKCYSHPRDANYRLSGIEKKLHAIHIDRNTINLCRSIRNDISILRSDHLRLQVCLEFAIVNYTQCEKKVLAMADQELERINRDILKILTNGVSEFIMDGVGEFLQIGDLLGLKDYLDANFDGIGGYANVLDLIKDAAGGVDELVKILGSSDLYDDFVVNLSMGFGANLSYARSSGLFKYMKANLKNSYDDVLGVGKSGLSKVVNKGAMVLEYASLFFNNVDEVLSGEISTERGVAEFIIEGGLTFGKGVATNALFTSVGVAAVAVGAPGAVAVGTAVAVTLGTSFLVDKASEFIFGDDDGLIDNITDVLIDDVAHGVGEFVNGASEKVWDMVNGFKPSLSFGLW